MEITPVLQALLVADRIYELAHNGGMVIAGTLNKLTLNPAPKSHQVQQDDGTRIQRVEARTPVAPNVYISLTDVHNNTELSIQLVDLSRNEVLMHTSFVIENGDRIGSTEIIAPMPPLNIIQRPGAYAIEVVFNDEILGSYRIDVVGGPEYPEE